MKALISPILCTALVIIYKAQQVNAQKHKNNSMKKTLLLTALLLTSAASAETYYCKTEIQALVNSLIVETQSEKLRTDFVVDLANGVKVGQDGDYTGSCTYEAIGKRSLIRCSDTLEYSTVTCTIFLQSL